MRTTAKHATEETARGLVLGPMATGLGCALCAAIFGIASGWGVLAIFGAYVGGGVFGVLGGGLSLAWRASRRW